MYYSRMVVTCLLILSQFSVAGNDLNLKLEYKLPSHEELVKLEVQALKASEGFRANAYYNGNVQYVGYGMRLHWNNNKVSIEQSRADFLLDSMVRMFVRKSRQLYPNSTTHYANARMMYAMGIRGSREVINQSTGNIDSISLIARAKRQSSARYLKSAEATLVRIRYATTPKLNISVTYEPTILTQTMLIFAEPKDGLQILWPVPQSLLTKPLIINTLTNQSYVKQKDNNHKSQCPIGSTSNCQGCTSTKRSRKCGAKGNGGTRKPSRSGR